MHTKEKERALENVKAIAKEGRRQLESQEITTEPDWVEMVHRIRKEQKISTVSSP